MLCKRIIYHKGKKPLFSYSDFAIQSSIPLLDIKAYFDELGAKEISCLNFTYFGLEIKVTEGCNNALKALNVPQNTIRAYGDSGLAEKFLTDFRFRFLSAGG